MSNTSYKEDYICLIHYILYHINHFSPLARVSYRYASENLSTSSLVWGPIKPYAVLYHLNWKGIGGWQKSPYGSCQVEVSVLSSYYWKKSEADIAIAENSTGKSDKLGVS